MFRPTVVDNTTIYKIRFRTVFFPMSVVIIYLLFLNMKQHCLPVFIFAVVYPYQLGPVIFLCFFLSYENVVYVNHYKFHSKRTGNNKVHSAPKNVQIKKGTRITCPVKRSSIIRTLTDFILNFPISLRLLMENFTGVDFFFHIARSRRFNILAYTR